MGCGTDGRTDGRTDGVKPVPPPPPPNNSLYNESHDNVGGEWSSGNRIQSKYAILLTRDPLHTDYISTPITYRGKWSVFHPG